LCIKFQSSHWAITSIIQNNLPRVCACVLERESFCLVIAFLMTASFYWKKEQDIEWPKAKARNRKSFFCTEGSYGVWVWNLCFIPCRVFFFPLIILSLTHTHIFIYRIWFRVVQVLEMSQSTKIMPAWLRCWP